MKLYLINKNPIISKLVALSVSKLGVEMEEAQEIDSSLSAQIVLIDDECFEKELFDAYKAANPEAKFCLFYAKSTERLEGFDEYIQKPFLPTDLVKILSKVSGITPIEHHAIHGKDSNETAEIEGAESLGNLDDELDLSSFDDLQLDDEPVADSNIGGDEQLDFGAEEGIEEMTENPDEQLDFGAEDENTATNPDENPDAQLDLGAEESATENPDEQLDFSAEDDSKEEQDLNVLDKSDVDEIKDLLSNEEETPKQTDESESLEKAIGDFETKDEKDDLDFSDLQNELDNIEVAEESKDEELESKDEELPPLETESAEELDLAGDLGLEDSTESKIGEEAEGLEVTSSEEAKEEGLDLDLPDEFNSEEAGDTKEDLNSLEGLGEEVDFNDLSEGSAEQTPLDMESQTPKPDLSSVDELDTLSLEDMSEALGEPIAKAPNPAPIVPNTDEADSALPSNIQANSLESLITALQALQAQNLKDLLGGATISINIQFPKKD